MSVSLNNQLPKFSLKKIVTLDDPKTAVEFLARYSDISKIKIKDAMNKGAVWLKKSKGKPYRIRRATATLKAGDSLCLYYDENLLALKPSPAKCISDQKRYSVWFKPAGLVTQGTSYGDHCSLMRGVELFFRNKRKVFLIHRLDREAAGILLVAHDKGAAGKLSRLFQDKSIVKHYRAQVLGNLAQKNPEDTIQIPLDDKPATTVYQPLDYDPSSNTTTVDIIIRTGRKHQIRRHFEMIGFPVMGDPRYGEGNKNTEGMKLKATRLDFKCPFSGNYRVFNIS
ncbi:Ribosomal large subunit pseudouridine synthase D (EC [Olavius sp. associated proteobacterium Delta 1]|nr:Ribosomal large subunit pseudouridine synthase D (EC [Olavius sp. associated proteobacterium Delta 1]